MAVSGINTNRRLNFRVPITTRKGSKVRLYHIYQDRIHGAYDAGNDDWQICGWTLDGYCQPADHRGQPTTSLDLINVEVPAENLPLAG